MSQRVHNGRFYVYVPVPLGRCQFLVPVPVASFRYTATRLRQLIPEYVPCFQQKRRCLRISEPLHSIIIIYLMFAFTTLHKGNDTLVFTRGTGLT